MSLEQVSLGRKPSEQFSSTHTVCRNSLILQKRLRSKIQPLSEYTAECSLSTTQGSTNYNWNSKRELASSVDRLLGPDDEFQRLGLPSTTSGYHYWEEVNKINGILLDLEQAVKDAQGSDKKNQAKAELKEYVDERKVIVKAAFEVSRPGQFSTKMSLNEMGLARRTARTS